MLDISLSIKCPWCGKSSPLKTWDDITFSKCYTREMKRKFRSLTKEGTWLKNSNKYFMCENCSRWLRASQLIIDSDKPELKKFGREPVIKSALNRETGFSTEECAAALISEINNNPTEKAK